MEEIKFSFTNDYQLEIASGLEVGTRHFLSALGSHLVHTSAGPVHDASVPMSSYEHQSLSASTSIGFPELSGEELMEIYPV